MPSQQVTSETYWCGTSVHQKALGTPTPAWPPQPPQPPLWWSQKSRSWDSPRTLWGPFMLTQWVQMAKESLSSLPSHRESVGHQRRKWSNQGLCWHGHAPVRRPSDPSEPGQHGLVVTK